MPAPRLLANRLAPLALVLAFAACDEGTPAGLPPGAVPAELRVLGGGGQLATVGAALPDELVVTAVDAAGRPIPGVGIRFAVVAGGGQVSRQTVTADDRGLARTRWTLGTVASDSQVVEARVEGLPASRIRAHVQAGAPAALDVSGGGAAGQVGAPLADSLAVRVTDRYGNPVEGVEVAWDVAAGGGSVSPARSFTRADGTAKGQWMLGPRVDSAQAVHLRVAGMDPVAFTAGAVTAGVPLQLAKRGGDGQRGVVGGVLADSLGVVLRMPDGRPVQGAVVDWSVPPDGGTVTPAVSRTDANGAASAAWRLGTGAGLVQATATVDEGTLIFTALTEASAPAQIVAVAGGGEGPVGGAMADSLAVRVTDAHGNPVPGAEVAWAAAGGSGAVQPAVSATDAQGVARAQWTLGLRAGDPAQTASATLGTLPAVAFHATASTRGVTLQFVRTGGDGQTGVVRGVLPDSLSVLLRTPAGLPVQGGTVAWTATAGGGQVSPATSRTDAQGRARAAWTMGAAIGPAQATARMDEGVLTFSAAARVGPPAAMQVLRGSGQSATRGTPVADSLVVRVVDAYGNPVAGAEVRWSVLTGGGRVENASTATRTDGTARTRWAVGYTPGENTAAAAVEGVPAVRFTGTGTAGTLRLNGGGPVSYHRAPGMISTLEVDAIIEVSVTDGQGNRAIRPNLTWALTSEELLPAPEWEPRPRRRWHQQFDEHGISGWVEFEGQRVWFFVPMSSLYGIDLYIPGNRYQATDTVPVDVSLMYVEANYPDDPGRYAEVQLYDDNGWTAEASIGPGLPPVSWPLGTRTGTRTLHACIPESIPGERYCESVTVIVDP